MREKIIAVLLCVFLGGFGIHRFYMGDHGVGVGWLLFTLLLVYPSAFIIGFFGAFLLVPYLLLPLIMLLALAPYLDLIYILRMSDEDWHQKYNDGKNPEKAYKYVKENTAGELEKLHDLKNKGVISEKEFQNRKKELL